MALNAGIILSGQQFDLMGAMNNGLALAQNQNALNRQREIEQLYKTQGNALMQGDTNALGQLAQYDPAAALGLKSQQQDMAFDAETMAMRREAARVATAEKLAAEAATLTAEQLAAEREALSGALQGGAFFYQNKDRAGYEAFLRSKGIDPAEYPFEAFPAHAADVEGVLEALDKFAPPEPKGPLSSAGKLQADIDAGILPPGTTATPDTVINMGGEGDAFYKKLDEAAAAMFSTLQTEGIQAGRTLGLIDRLDGLMQQSPTGAGAALTRLAGEVGIDVGGLGEVQAIDALINQIVPQQRQPGSGPMSDADLALFKKSVPRLINTPEGNAKIIATMRAINLYVQEQAAIADKVANREITPAEGRSRLKALTNPLDGFTAAGATGTATPSPKGPVVVDGFTIEAIE